MLVDIRVCMGLLVGCVYVDIFKLPSGFCGRLCYSAGWFDDC